MYDMRLEFDCLYIYIRIIARVRVRFRVITHVVLDL